MSNKQDSAGADPARPFIISRVFDAPRDLVFKAFTESDRMMKWWGPKGCVVRSAKLDVRPGGTFHYLLVMSDGKEIWGKWVIREIVKPERLVFVSSFSDEKGSLTRHPFAPEWPLELLTTLVFAEHDGKTAFNLRWEPVNATAAEIKTFDAGRTSMQGGWSGTLDQLTEYLAKA